MLDDIQKHLCTCCAIACLLAIRVLPTQANQDDENRIRAGFVLNFMKFTDWPKARMEEGPLIVGLLGSREATAAFRELEQMKIGDRNLSVRWIAEEELLERSAHTTGPAWQSLLDLCRPCHVLVFPDREAGPSDARMRLFRELQTGAVLTIGRGEPFIEGEGIIAFVTHDERIRFEINLVAARKSGIQIRSKLLRLARRVIQ